MSAAPITGVTLGDQFARELPELAVHWSAESAPDPRLLVLNEPLAGELGLDPGWLRTPDGLALLVGAAIPAGATPRRAGLRRASVRRVRAAAGGWSGAVAR